MNRGLVGVTNIAHRETLLFIVSVLVKSVAFSFRLLVGSRFLFVASLSAVRPVEIQPRAYVDRNVDHLAVDRDRRHAALQSFGKNLAHLDVVRSFFGGRPEAFVARLDPRRVVADRAFESGVPRAL